MKQSISTVEITKAIENLHDGVVLDEAFPDRPDGSKIADFLIESTGLVIELKIIESDFLTPKKFHRLLDEVLREFDIPEWYANEVVMGVSEEFKKPRSQFWRKLSRPAKDIVSNAKKQLQATKDLLGSRYNHGVLFVGVDGAPEADFGMIQSLFMHHLSQRHSETVEAMLLFSASREYRFENGSRGSIGTTAYAPDRTFLREVIEPLIPHMLRRPLYPPGRSLALWGMT